MKRTQFSWGPLLRAGLPFGQRFQWALFTAGQGLGGEAQLATTLVADPNGEYVHTTELAKGSFVLFRSEERITIGSDGSSLAMRGAFRFWPRFRLSIRYEATGRVESDGKGARYAIPLLGAELLQTTEIIDEGLRLTEETPWAKWAVVLRRRWS